VYTYSPSGRPCKDPKKQRERIEEKRKLQRTDVSDVSEVPKRMTNETELLLNARDALCETLQLRAELAKLSSENASLAQNLAQVKEERDILQQQMSAMLLIQIQTSDYTLFDDEECLCL
jgi:hypothetical protein